MQQFPTLMRLARAAKRDGLTLSWSLNVLREKLERAEQEIAHTHEQDTRSGDPRTQQVQLEAEALALVLMAVIRAYPAGADINVT